MRHPIVTRRPSASAGLLGLVLVATLGACKGAEVPADPIPCEPACAVGYRCGDDGVCAVDPAWDAGANPGPDGGGGCQPACLAPTPICNARGRCVACADDAQCPAGTYCKVLGDGTTVCAIGCKDDARCGAGRACCGGQCLDTTSDVRNCGGCGVACSAAHQTPSCAASVCKPGACSAGWGDCNANPADGCEVNLRVDDKNCAACGAVCAADHAVSACANDCYLAACEFGWDDCNANPMDGCETSVLTDTANCGACGQACVGRNNAKVACANAVCGVIGCDLGFADCDQMSGNGCERNIATDSANCGACGVVCPMGQVCKGGACTCPQCDNAFPNAAARCENNQCVFDACKQGYGNCDGDSKNGCEVDLNVSNAHCGACGTVCDAKNGINCRQGNCVLGPACGGWVFQGGCWYTTAVNESCNAFCQAHGGFDPAATKHVGNPVCTHFYPQKANGNNWVPIECCSIDNNTNWGADGNAPDPAWTHAACHLACACKF